MHLRWRLTKDNLITVADPTTAPAMASPSASGHPAMGSRAPSASAEFTKRLHEFLGTHMAAAIVRVLMDECDFPPDGEKVNRQGERK